MKEIISLLTSGKCRILKQKANVSKALKDENLVSKLGNTHENM